MTLSEAIRDVLTTLAVKRDDGSFTKGVVRLVDRTDVFVDGDTGLVMDSNREYTAVRIGRVQQVVRTSQLAGG